MLAAFGAAQPQIHHAAQFRARTAPRAGSASSTSAWLPCGNRTICRAAVGDQQAHAQFVPRLGPQPLDQRQPPAHPTLVPPQQLRHFHLAHSVFPHQRLNDPGFFQFPRAAAGAIQPVDGGLRRPLVGLHEPGRQMLDLRQAAHRAQAFETVDQFVALLAAAHHHRRQLPIPLQRSRHGAFRFRHVQAIASVVFADFLALQIEQILSAQRSTRVPSLRTG